MKDVVAFELRADYEDFSGGNVSLVEGEMYDVGEALEEGDGRIVLGPGARRGGDESLLPEEEQRAFRDAQIVDALDKYPALKRTSVEEGDEPASYADVDLTEVAEQNREDLLHRAGELNITGRHSMTKERLEEAIAAKEAELAEETQAESGDEEPQDQGSGEETGDNGDGEGGAGEGDVSAEGSGD